MFKISFDFDEVSQKVTNIKIESKKVNQQAFDMEVEENKLSLTSEAIKKLGATTGDRISVNYWTVDNENTYPIISKSDVFTDGDAGNKLTGKGTISFKGQQRTSLLKFGNLFEFGQFIDKSGRVRDNVFVLKPVKDDRLSTDAKIFNNEKEIVEELNASNVEDEISAILDEETENVLPF